MESSVSQPGLRRIGDCVGCNFLACLNNNYLIFHYYYFLTAQTPCLRALPHCDVPIKAECRHLPDNIFECVCKPGFTGDGFLRECVGKKLKNVNVFNLIS